MGKRSGEPAAGNGSGHPGRVGKFWSAHVGPILYDPFLSLGEIRGMSGLRREIVGRASGRVLELGAGTGLNLRHYRADLDELVLTEPEPGMLERLERRRARVTPANSRVLGTPAEQLPVADGTFDAVVATLVFCTVANPAAALLEARRVLRDGGKLLFIEHVRAPAGSKLERFQERLHKPWRAFASGCRCDQDTMSLIEHAGFARVDDRPERWRGMPRIVQPLIYGEARPISRAAEQAAREGSPPVSS
ncbi:MAG TPA: class I SAM-dependent methyltransferase [Solirubrobacteraceae bacterium]|nr:class I SAM-dependent methyltransferase [Solirubrobacteraceae bacterium]